MKGCIDRSWILKAWMKDRSCAIAKPKVICMLFGLKVVALVQQLTNLKLYPLLSMAMSAARVFGRQCIKQLFSTILTRVARTIITSVFLGY